ncbi:hypothetical protein RRG08_045633 [Elysia crispata]|uniref:Uncharacterized protein n=1 Tax=Elysia crispata TaxID=231223 RepID=A0AAE0XZJ1_9GAST|nr:hypothetical protein RRG08_045633 [Elysia crispata]
MWELSGCHRGTRQNTGVWKLETVGTRGVTEGIRQHEIREAREYSTRFEEARECVKLGVSQRDKHWLEHGSLEARECGNSRGVTEGIRQNTEVWKLENVGTSRSQRDKTAMGDSRS